MRKLKHLEVYRAFINTEELNNLIYRLAEMLVIVKNPYYVVIIQCP